MMEINATVAHEVTNDLAIAFGFRLVDTNGVVKSSGIINILAAGGVGVASRDMTGESIDYGYNLALAYHPIENLELSATFSAAAYTFPSKTTVEFVYEIVYWSAYETLDFDYDGTEDTTLVTIFGGKVAKNWKDTYAFRLGLTQELDSVTLMAGAVIDESPTPEETLNFESPGSDSLSVSLGGRYQIDESLNIGFSVLYSMKEDKDISSSVNVNKINGTLSNSNTLLISADVGYKF